MVIDDNGWRSIGGIECIYEAALPTFAPCIATSAWTNESLFSCIEGAGQVDWRENGIIAQQHGLHWRSVGSIDKSHPSGGGDARTGDIRWLREWDASSEGDAGIGKDVPSIPGVAGTGEGIGGIDCAECDGTALHAQQEDVVPEGIRTTLAVEIIHRDTSWTAQTNTTIQLSSEVFNVVLSG